MSAGTTGTVALMRGDRVYVAGVGDSRCVATPTRHAPAAALLPTLHDPGQHTTRRPACSEQPATPAPQLFRTVKVAVVIGPRLCLWLMTASCCLASPTNHPDSHVPLSAVMVRNGRAVHMTTDHRPDAPEVHTACDTWCRPAAYLAGQLPVCACDSR
jgi:hypothetical protein